MAQTLATPEIARAPAPLLARISQGANGEPLAFLGTQRCFFDPGVTLPKAGTELPVTLSRPVFARNADGFVDYTRMLGLLVRVIAPAPPSPVPVAAVAETAPRRATASTLPPLSLAA